MEDYHTHLHRNRGNSPPHPPPLISNLTAGMAQSCPGEAALWSLPRVHLSGVAMILHIWRNFRMAAAEGLACPAWEAQKTFHNELVRFTSKEQSVQVHCPRFLQPIPTTTACGRTIQKAAMDPTSQSAGLHGTAWAVFLWHRGLQAVPWQVRFPHKQPLSPFGSRPACYHCA